MSVDLRTRVRNGAPLPLGAAVLVAFAGNILGAQSPLTPRRTWLETTAGGPLEAYVRLLTLDTARATYPVGERTYSPREVEAIARGAGAGHPWTARFADVDPAHGAVRVTVLRPEVDAIVNTAFPFGMNMGAVWAGRGPTTALRAGAVVEAGALTLRLEPVAFRAENASFPLFDNGLAGDARFRDPITPGNIDLPQRFGNGPYQRVDLGNSEVRVDALGLAAGFSNVNEVWGPAETHPLILGANAPGFLHGFVGTGRPISLGFGRVHGRLEAGRLEQSAYSPAPDSLRYRAMAGAVASFLPAGPFEGLELGATRFFHRRWRGRIQRGDILTPIDGLLFKQGKSGVDDPSSPEYTPDNQISSVFGRWAFPRAGFEVYGEFLRNDAALDLREVEVEPDHQSAYTLGVQHLLRSSPMRWTVLRGEFVNSRTTNINRVRPQDRLYQHGILLQGHTDRGEVLGSVAVLGGGGFVLGWDQYTPDGKRTVEFHRILRLTPLGEGAPTERQADAQYVLRADRTVFRRGVDLTYGGGGVYEMNRDFRRDAFNLLLSAGVRWGR